MSDYKIILSRPAQKQLDKLSDHIANPIFKAIRSLSKNPRPGGCKKLTGRPGYRIRVGDYRIIYEIINKELVVTVVSLGHRKDVYE